ncbi:Hydrogen dehydrogenase [uncultured Desulfatiglans sp.]|uniref:Hydrogen dehydrogenase n=1 Tax=Uncultured Desulfatiglans sp. TaxID=1748965 RepID=A0A653AHH4_UNCDX|nr:Hydrogen dehydrogenase [uncultured Desulfatiglans sp.]
MKGDKTIEVDVLARVEGEGGLFVKIKGGQVESVQFRIFEPPRFFEALLCGRCHAEAPDITARICGICPIAYMTSSSQAMESAFGARLTGPLRELRRLIYCGEWIESHGLHIYMLHAPDFLGCADAIELAGIQPEVVKRGLRLKAVGNRIVTLLGGREIHPVNFKVGGFYRVPGRRELLALTEDLEWARDAAYDTVRWVAGFDFPVFEQDYEFVSMHHPDEYAVIEGRLVSSEGIDIPLEAFEAHFREEQAAHSTALHAAVKARGPYMVGPMARFNLNFDQLPPMARRAAEEVGYVPPCRNPFKSIVVRAIEVLCACETALDIVAGYDPPPSPAIDFEPHSATAYGCSEAPRGICWHRYALDEEGVIRSVRIVPPTSQNQAVIERDLRRLVERYADLPEDRLTWLCEQAIRNYDPCISCSCHVVQTC